MMAISTLIHNVRVFDGEQLISDHGYIVFQDGLIKDIGATDPSPLPSTDEIIDGFGCTILPGLIDAHVHSHGGARELAQTLAFGVTTVLDMFNEPEYIAEMKKESSERSDIADIKSACHAATVSGGWPEPIIFATIDDKEEAKIKIERWPQLRSPEQAESFVIDMKSKGADYIKLIQESGSALVGHLFPLPVPSPEIQSAVVVAAHKHGLITVAHALTQKDTFTILRAGTNGLTHSFCDEAPKDELLTAYQKNNAFLIPAVVLSATLTGEEMPSTEHLARHTLSSKVLNASDTTCFCGRLMLATEGCKAEYSYQAVRMLQEGGIDIVAGTDTTTGLAGTAFGLSLHHELYLYVKRCGLTPLEALHSATSTTARRFKLEDRGRLAKGKRADLLMVKGDPTNDISCTLNITGVWRGGVAIEKVN